ncbi:MFS transporter [Yinghuangia seranimata]|uniref:MFS transporter n=1 Tax=Yinghuangia seranimata TaxID=408067 RepID=UPI00248B5E12|nr:MFS transporter [Yinghuangia seranimata]MDI2124924.1 MFS transporter [Yinghuangia seranimata]
MTETVVSRPAGGAGTVTERPARGRAGLLLATVLTGQFMALLDVSVVNVAAPTMRSDLGASGSSLQLIVAGYTIVYAALIVTGSRLGGMLGYRRMFLAGLAVFTGASLACGLAPGTGSLIGARGVQGAGAALMVPQVLSVIQRQFQGEARAKALGRYAAVIAGGAVAGQILGGVLVSADLFGLSWRPVFLVNVPVGLVLLAVAPRVMPDDRAEAARGLDLRGLLVVSPALVLVVVPLVLGHDQGWPVWGWVCMALGLLLFPVFARVEQGVARSGGAPLVPGHLLRTRGVVAAAVTLLLMMASYAGFLFTVALYLQGGLGYSALHAGLVFVPPATLFAVVSLNWQRLPARWYPTLPAVALVPAAAAYLTLAWAQHEDAPQLALIGTLMAIGLTLAAAFSPVMALGLRRVPPADAPDASGILATVVQFGQVVGVAVFGTVFLEAGGGPGNAGWVTGVGLASAALLAAVSALALRRS